MANLPLNASIAKSHRELFDDEHLAKDDNYADLVCCVGCSDGGSAHGLTSICFKRRFKVGFIFVCLWCVRY